MRLSERHLSMLKQMCIQLGVTGSFSKLLYMRRLLLQNKLFVGKGKQFTGSISNFSTNTVKSDGGMSRKSQADDALDWEEDQSHASEEEPGSHENKLHVPVMVEEVKQIFTDRMPKTIIDMTFGAGGHSRALLDCLSDCKILALDRDPHANRLAQELAEQRPGKVVPLLGRFSDLSELLMEQNIPPGSVDGALFDLGASSMQFDQSDRGFSLSKDGPLDMRMDGNRLSGQPTAADVVNILDEEELGKILRKYGDETRDKKIAHAIVDARAAFGKITTTQQLADIISCVFPGSYTRDSLNRNAHIATKTFQALRIFVNNEMNELHNGLELVNKYLKLGGVCVALSFHSLEDRIVKRHFHNIELDLPNNVRIQQRAKLQGIFSEFSKEDLDSLLTKKWQPLHKKVVLPSEEEVHENPRSRSAKLRAAVKS